MRGGIWILALGLELEYLYNETNIVMHKESISYWINHCFIGWLSLVILQGYVIRFYPTELSLSAMMSLFGTIQTAIVSVCVVSWSSWDLKWEKGLVLVTILLGVSHMRYVYLKFIKFHLPNKPLIMSIGIAGNSGDRIIILCDDMVH